MKSSAPLAVVGILGRTLLASCVQTRETSTANPPATSYQVSSFELEVSGSSQKIRGASVTSAFFQSVKGQTLLGRGFLPEEYGSGGQPVAMVSNHFWQQQFAGDPRIIGATLRLNGRPCIVVGVMPTTFDVPSGVDIWVPKAG